jgi:hypothetical protein
MHFQTEVLYDVLADELNAKILRDADAANSVWRLRSKWCCSKVKSYFHMSYSWRKSRMKTC